MKEQHRRKNLTVTILSLSLLTVMAGAAVAPALSIIRTHFADVNQLLVQMIISVPALFIVLTNLIFPKLIARFPSRTLLLFGLSLYTVGGAIAGLFDNIYVVLFFRALVGIGVGIIMPMSTGLLSFYYTRDKQDKLMGYSSAMNQMGGAVATLLSGVLAGISWKYSFLVYLMGLISIVLCLRFLPNEYIGSASSDRKNSNVHSHKDITPSATGVSDPLQTQTASEDITKQMQADRQVMHSNRQKSVFTQYNAFIIAMFLLMVTFFIFPCEFALETVKEGIIPQQYISVIMSGMDLVAFLGGLSFVLIKKIVGRQTRIVAPLLFVLGYTFLAFDGGWSGAIVGALFVGFANGLGIPYLIATASKKAGRAAGSTVMPLLSAALYLAQFLTPMVLSAVSNLLASVQIAHLPYCIAFGFAVLFAVWSSFTICEDASPDRESVRQEA